MRRFIFTIVTLSFVLCGAVDSVHASGWDIETDGFAAELNDGSDHRSHDHEQQDSHSCVHHHDHGTMTTAVACGHGVHVSQFGFTRDDMASDFRSEISEPPRS